MALYEVMWIARQDMAPAQVEELAEAYGAKIKEMDGNVLKINHWGVRTLAYRINKNRKGHYVVMNLDCPAAALHEMERNMRLSEDVLRYMSIRVEAFEEEVAETSEDKEAA